MRRKHGALFHVLGSTWTRLAAESDRAEALRRWAEIEGEPAPAGGGTLADVWAKFEREPAGLAARAPRTQKDYRKDAARLLAVFGPVQIEDITPQHVRRYLDLRVDKHGKPAHVRATREKALLSLLCSCAREWGIMRGANPCAGIRGWKAKRTRYITDDELARILEAAIPSARDALEIALLTGQRPADVRKMKRSDIRDGALWVTQNKTGERLGVAITGRLAVVIERCKARAAAARVPSLYLLTTEDGAPYNAWTLMAHVRAAAKAAGVPDAQMRDMRAKAATDLDDLAKAQALLGHRNRAMTEEYVRERRGKVVEPFARPTAPKPKNKRQ